MASGHGRYDEASEPLEEALSLFESAGELGGVADCLDEMGRIHWYRGVNSSYREALSSFMKALSLRRKQQNTLKIALSLTNIGNIHLSRGHIEEAREAFQEALLLRRANDDRLGLAQTLSGMGLVHFACGRTGDAEKLWREGLAFASEVGGRELSAIMQERLGEAALQQGRVKDAEVLLGAAFDTASDLNDRRTQASCLRNKARLAARRQHWERALMLSRESEEMAIATGGKQILGSCLAARGEILSDMLKQGIATEGKDLHDVEKDASAAFQRASVYFEEMGDMLGLGRVLEAYGAFLQERGVANKARKLLARAKKVRSAFSEQA